MWKIDYMASINLTQQEQLLRQYAIESIDQRLQHRMTTDQNAGVANTQYSGVNFYCTRSNGTRLGVKVEHYIDPVHGWVQVITDIALEETDTPETAYDRAMKGVGK
jgi:hypothetical protein